MSYGEKPLLRRFFAGATAAVMLTQTAFAASAPSVPADYQSPFSDAQEGQWFYPFVATLNSQGVIDGYPDGTFGPNNTTQTGDALLMILKAAGTGTLVPEEGGHYASGYVNYAVEQGWLSAEEVPELTGPVSRLLVARVAAQALGLTASEKDSPFADLNDGYVTALYEKGLISGVQEGDTVFFYPENSMTRAEISAVVWQVQEYATHILFRGEYLDILDSVPVNPYQKSAFVTENGRMRYSDDQVESILGVDVSSHQQEIDWQAVAADGIQFAVIRVAYRGSTIGNLLEDTYARANLKGALDAGLEVGVYVFSQAVSEEEAREEARMALDIVKDYDITGPIVFDWENMSYEARTDGLSANLLTAAANAFCDTVAQAGYQPMVYFNLHIGYLLYHLDGIAQYPFWLAEYNPAPTFYYNFQMLQYSSSGSVNGISGRTDMNIWLRAKAQSEQPEQADQPEQTETQEETKPSQDIAQTAAAQDSTADDIGFGQAEDTEETTAESANG